MFAAFVVLYFDGPRLRIFAVRSRGIKCFGCGSANRQNSRGHLGAFGLLQAWRLDVMATLAYRFGIMILSSQSAGHDSVACSVFDDCDSLQSNVALTHSLRL